jgi:anthranilate synthase/aminodeoxychorismate synthase-like glutamine amidotransferase
MKKVLLIDNFDSFTYNITDYLRRLGAIVTVKERPMCSMEDFLQSDAVLISPGPGNPQQMPDLMSIVKTVVGLRPVLGICLGHQALAHHFGSDIVKSVPRHGKCSKVQKIHDSVLLLDLPVQFSVVRYHSLVVSNLAECLNPILITSDWILMAFEHKELPVWGVQFHPEAHLTEFGLQLLRNWLENLDVD